MTEPNYCCCCYYYYSRSASLCWSLIRLNPHKRPKPDFHRYLGRFTVKEFPFLARILSIVYAPLFFCKVQLVVNVSIKHKPKLPLVGQQARSLHISKVVLRVSVGSILADTDDVLNITTVTEV